MLGADGLAVPARTLRVDLRKQFFICLAGPLEGCFESVFGDLVVMVDELLATEECVVVIGPRG